METIRRNVRQFDFVIVTALLGLAFFSCVALLAATYGKTNLTDVPTNILPKQIMFEVLGFIAIALAAMFDYRSLRRIHWYVYGICMVLLAAVYGMHRVNNAHSWIRLGMFSFQPSEFAKLAMIISIATYMASIDEQEFPDYSVKKLLPVAGMVALPFVLTLPEPALGQALVMVAIALTMIAVFAKRWHFALMSALMFLFISFVSVIALQYPGQATSAILKATNWQLFHHHLLQKFQAARVITWLNPTWDLSNTGYNVHQAQIAVGSGQVFGEGLFSGIETKGNWIPNQSTDFIFTAIAEEFGFVASSILIVLFLVLIYRLVRIAGTAQDTFGTYLIMGVVGMFGFQVFENIGMNMYLSPSTGITLPFISYGGTSLVANCIAVGLALSVGLRRKKLRFS